MSPDCPDINLGSIKTLTSVQYMSKSEYLKLADAIAAEIADGTLKPGDRLPPQRNFAYERKIAVSTAGRVYAELLRRGLVVGEVGRGTFISGDARRGVAAPSEPRGIRIDFEFNYPMLPDQTALIAKSLDGLEKPAALDAALRQGTSSEYRRSEALQPRTCRRAHGPRPLNNSCSPATDGRALPQHWPQSFLRAAAAAWRL